MQRCALKKKYADLIKESTGKNVCRFANLIFKNDFAKMSVIEMKLSNIL